MITKMCKTCNKEFQTSSYRIKMGRGKYCSKKCFSAKCSKTIHICKICRKKFLEYKSNDRKFCSKECKYLAGYNHTQKWKEEMSIKNTGKNNPFYGCKHTIKTRKKISIFLKGKPSPIKGRKFPERSGKNNPSWKGGKITDERGYVFIHQPNHPFSRKSGYIKESRLVMEKILGRYLTPEEVVHHNGLKYPMGSYENKGDNRPENLELFPNKSAHTKYHQLLKKSAINIP